MRYRVLPYTLKVWLGSVLLTPVIQIMVQLITQVPYKFNSVRDVMVYFIYMLVCGWLSTWVSNLLTSKIRLIKAILSVAGALIAILPFITYAGNSLPHYDNTDFIWVMLYPITIIMGIWVFTLYPIVENKDLHGGSTASFDGVDEPVTT
jgi:hypothetical protein